MCAWVACNAGRPHAPCSQLAPCSEPTCCPATSAPTQGDCKRLEGELRDYKARAHVLLKAKETELKAARDIVRCACFGCCCPLLHGPAGKRSGGAGIAGLCCSAGHCGTGPPCWLSQLHYTAPLVLLQGGGAGSAARGGGSGSSRRSSRSRRPAAGFGGAGGPGCTGSGAQQQVRAAAGRGTSGGGPGGARRRGCQAVGDA